MRFKVAATTFATAILTATWGDEGHKVIALIAYGFLTLQAKSRIETLLQADDDALTPKDFASRATWADKFRDGPGPETAKWHYVNLEIRRPDLRIACFGNPALRGDASRGPAQDCIVDKITQFEHELSAPGYDPAEQVLALKYLLHFVGDVHQPLHASDDHDAGGNCELVSYAGGLLFGIGRATVKLHAYWDTAVVHKQGEDPRALAVKLTSKISAKQLSDWQAGSPRDWAWDSYNVARQASYNIGRRPSCDTGRSGADNAQ